MCAKIEGRAFLQPFRRGSGRGTAGYGEEHRHRVLTKFLGVLRIDPDSYDTAHVLPPVLSRQCELRGLGLYRLSRESHGGLRGSAIDQIDTDCHTTISIRQRKVLYLKV